MALIELKQCPHCGHTTWQEFVPLSPPSPSYWRCRDCGERRQAARICVTDAALLHRGRLQTKSLCTDACILDISRGGARVRLASDSIVQLYVGEKLLFNAQLQPFGELSRYLPVMVRWLRKQECGLAFAHPLSLSAVDIRCIIKN